MSADFSSRLRRLADEAELRIDEIKGNTADLIFDMGRGHRQVLFVRNSDDTLWEVVCPSNRASDDPTDLPKTLLVHALKESANNRRGFWCLERIGDKYYLACMQNERPDPLDARVFDRTCRELVKEVEALESVFR